MLGREGCARALTIVSPASPDASSAVSTSPCSASACAAIARYTLRSCRTSAAVKSYAQPLLYTM